MCCVFGSRWNEGRGRGVRSMGGGTRCCGDGAKSWAMTWEKTARASYYSKQKRFDTPEKRKKKRKKRRQFHSIEAIYSGTGDHLCIYTHPPIPQLNVELGRRVEDPRRDVSLVFGA